MTRKMKKILKVSTKGLNSLAMLAATLLMSLPSIALADSPGSGYGYPMMGWGWSGMIIGPIVMIAVLAGVVAVVVLIFRWLGTGHLPVSSGSQGSENTALDILRKRYARGEIDKDEFEEKRRILEE